MRSSFNKVLLIASLGLGMSSLGHAQQQYWAQYGNLPVNIQQNNNGAVQTLKFVNYKDGMLIAQLDGGVGEIALPVNDYLVSTLRLDLSSLGLAKAFLDQQNYEGALEVMRPVVYPLIKFYQVPDSFTQLQNPIHTFFETLIRAGDLKEADFVLQKIDLSKASLRYSQDAIVLMNAYIQNGDFDDVARLAASLPVDGEYAANMRPVIDAADALRAAGQYEDVIPLYQAIKNAVPEELKPNIRMWLAYSLVLADRLDEANPIIDSLEEPDPKDRLFSLYKLLQGSRAHRLEDYSQALDVLTRGFVRAQASYVWVPEMLYLIGDCYSRSEDNIAARNVWTEIATLYPNSPWAAKASAAIEALPQS